MRHLIAVQQRDLAGQGAFFERWIGPTGGPLCDAIEALPESLVSINRSGDSRKRFFDIEQGAFEML